MKTPTLTVITDRALCRGPLAETVRQAVAAGADVIQLRENDLETRALLELASALKGATRGTKAKLIINHSVDVALAVGADGVHLGWRSLNPEHARRLLGPGKVIGVSVHTPEELLDAEHGGADYVHYGPIFDTPSKHGKAVPVGCAALRKLRPRTSLPLIAVGGIKAENAADVIASGADGVAVISAVMGAPDAQVAVRNLKKELEFGKLKRGV